MKTARRLAGLLFVSVSALAAEPAGWQAVVAPLHRPSVEQTLEMVRLVNAGLAAGPLRQVPYPLEQRAFAPTVAFSDAEILGAWKSHSLQCGLPEDSVFQDGVRGYVTVAASITRSKEGQLIFDKSSGPLMVRGYL